MTGGMLVGVGVAAGVWLVLRRLVALAPLRLSDRLELHLHRGRSMAPMLDESVSATVEGLVRPYAARAADRLERIVGGGESVQRRLLRAGGRLTLQEFRMQQVLWGSAAFALAAAVSLLMVASGSARSPGLLVVFTGGAAVAGVMARDQVLSRAVRSREATLLSELPTVADLLAVSVAAGESPASALERTARVARGELGHELRLVLADVRAGSGLVMALDDMSRRLAVPAVTRFVDGITVAVDRGTPLADVLRAQACDAREVRKRTLMDVGGRKEILMLVPVVFLVLPVTVLFALYPGLAHFEVIAP